MLSTGPKVANLILVVLWCGCSGSGGSRDASPSSDTDGVEADQEIDGDEETSPDADSYTRPPGPWLEEQWWVVPFTKAMGGGPDFGPAADVGASVHSLTADADGNTYIIVSSSDIGVHRVDIITAAGVRMPLAGTGRRGFRDGPAARAQFDFSGLAYQPTGIQIDDRGNIFVADTGNRRIRRIFRDDDGDWQVDTWAGGGEDSLEVGDVGDPLQIDLGRVIVAASRDGRVVGCGMSGCYMIDAEGAQIRSLGRVEETDSEGNLLRMNVFRGDCDNDGVCYFITRSPDFVIRVTPSGEVARIAGFIFEELPKPHHLGDLPPLEAYFDTPPSLVADPDGEAVYICGGDEYDVRRVPTDMVTTTATLVKNGRWYIMEEHPNRNRGPAEFDPTVGGVSSIVGGDLTNLAVAPLAGGDRLGRLYGYLNHWTGATIRVDGSLLPTRVFRLERR